MAKYDFDIGVIGGGAAGLTVAAGAAQLGVKTLLIERAPKLGGDCLHTGCVPSKTLIKTASVYHHMKNSTRYGLPQAEVPPVIMTDINTHIHSVIDHIQHHDSEERFCALGVKVVFGEAGFIDEHQVECGGKQFSAKFWVLAAGSEPVAPPVEGLESVPYLTNEDLFSLDELPSSLLVLGGGPIGCEMAQAFSRLGCKVTILQRNFQILPAEDQDMAEVVLETLRSEGVSVELSAQLRSVKEIAGGVAVSYEQNGQLHTVTTEKLLVAAGRKASVEALKLDNCGVEFDHHGVKVDSRLRTTQKHIFAAGDMTGKYRFTHAAGYEGSIVISNAVFRLPRKVDYTWLPWCTYTDPELASVGLNERRAEAEGVGYDAWVEEFGDNDRARAEGEYAGRIKLLLNKREKPIGVQIVGLHAGELLGEWVAALNGKLGLSTMASAVHPYPTMGEINKRVAGKVLSPKLFSEKVRKTLAFIFDYKGRACTLD